MAVRYRQDMEIHLTQGQITVVDDVDADLASLGWYALRLQRGFYAERNVPKPDGTRTKERLHQLVARRKGIVGPPDHKDRNGLNNRRDNLRPASRGQNGANRSLFANNTSGFKGVTWNKARGKWKAYIRVDHERRHLGYFDDAVSAAKAYDRAALEAFGEFAFLNFPAPAATAELVSP